jgi:hypothetical protein
MRANVLPDVRRTRLAGRFVWLSIDTEQPRNAAFLERFPIASYPTFLVIDPRSELPILKWLGSASAAQLEKLLADARRRWRSGPEAILARADRAQAEGRVDDAVPAYLQALARAGPRWSRRPRAVESLVLALSSAGQQQGCAETARDDAPRLPRGASFANAVATGLGCALAAPADALWRPGALSALEPLAREAVALPGLLADDRAGLFDALVDARGVAGDERGAHAIALRWWAFLEDEGRRARTAEARAALDGMRVAAARACADPARALPALEASEKELPADYNPPARRAALLLDLGRLAEARAAAERALRLAYGPRKLKLYQLAVKVLERQGDRAALAAALDEALAFAGTLPTPQRDDRVVAALRARHEQLDGTSQ